MRKATLDYAMGRNHNEKGEIIFAIPKGYFDGNLQLKTITKQMVKLRRSFISTYNKR